MASTQTPWQHTTSFMRSHRYMLEHEIATDVKFTFPKAEGGSDGILRAHRYMLICRSPVFEVMLTSEHYVESSSKSGSIVIPDIEEDIFQELLRYVYYDGARLDGKNILRVLYAAKKYLLNGLVKKCHQYLREKISPENVCTILNNALEFSETEMVQYCLGYVALHADEVFECEAFLGLHQEALFEILRCDGIGLKSESLLFEKCVQWARSQDGKQGRKSVRDSLGMCLCEIRFSSVDAKELAYIIAMEPDVLSFEEQASFFRYIADPQAGLIDAHQRGRDLRKYQVDRFPFVRNGKEKPLKHDTDIETIYFTTDTLVNLHAISVYGDDTKTAEFSLDVSIRSQNDTISAGNTKFRSCGTTKPIPLEDVFQKPCLLLPGVNHEAIVSCSPRGKHRYYGISGWDTVKIEGVTFQFSSNNTKAVRSGHIAQLFFTKVT